MEIDITDFVMNEDAYEFSGSVAERGPLAGPQTWANAKQEAARKPLLVTDEQLDAMRQWVKDSGGWECSERKAMTPEDLNALFIQLISGDMREMGLDDDFADEFDWEAYGEKVEQGQLSGNLFRGDVDGHPGQGRIFYYLES